jgi:hypothetical protein
MPSSQEIQKNTISIFVFAGLALLAVVLFLILIAKGSEFLTPPCVLFAVSLAFSVQYWDKVTKQKAEKREWEKREAVLS